MPKKTSQSSVITSVSGVGLVVVEVAKNVYLGYRSKRIEAYLMKLHTTMATISPRAIANQGFLTKV